MRFCRVHALSRRQLRPVFRASHGASRGPAPAVRPGQSRVRAIAPRSGRFPSRLPSECVPKYAGSCEPIRGFLRLSSFARWTGYARGARWSQRGAEGETGNFAMQNVEAKFKLVNSAHAREVATRLGFEARGILSQRDTFFRVAHGTL